MHAGLETMRRTRSRWLLRGLALFALGMTVLASVASREHHSVENARDAVLSRLVALEARDLESSDRSLAIQLALVGYRLSRTPEARSALIDTTAAKMPVRTKGAPLRSLSYSPDGQRLYVNATATPAAGALALRRTRAATRVASSALSPNGRLFAVACEDGRIWLWDVSTPARPKLLAKLGGFSRRAHTVTFAPNSQLLFAGSADHTVRLWDLTRPAKPEEFTSSPLTGPRSTVEQVALSPDGATLAASTADGQVWLWGVGSPARASVQATLLAASGRLTAVAFSPSDNTLVAGSSDGHVTSWSYRPYQIVDAICAVTGTPITAGEWEQYVQGAPYRPPCRA